MKVKCPQCEKLTEYEGNRYRPFCSERCKVIDLGDWASGKYTMPADENPPTAPSKESNKNQEDDEIN